MPEKSYWALIPARGGSKSIPYKNLAPLAGRPLLDYVIGAGKAVPAISRIICSTEDRKISDFCAERGVDVHPRPKRLAADDTDLIDVLVHLIRDYEIKGHDLPWAIVLLMPTSPFILPEHIHACMEALEANPRARSAQTIASFTHNHHAYNQRVITNGSVRFSFPRQRKTCYNKQTKPKFFSFGNLAVTRTKAILDGRGVFAQPSLPHQIPEPYAMDADGPTEFELAAWYIESGKVELPHLSR